MGLDDGFNQRFGSCQVGDVQAGATATRCRAWTYLRPGYGGPAARCFLKDRVKPPRRRPCCISGVVR